MGTLGKIWKFIWNGKGVASFIVQIAIIFILIRFIVYPGLGLILGTSLPIVAVVSGSMEHNADFDSWWESSCCSGPACPVRDAQGTLYRELNITKEQFKTFPLRNGFNKGDIIVLRSAKETDRGDIIVFSVAGQAEPVIHRVVTQKETTTKTKGDNNCISGSFEQAIKEEHIIGKALFRIPYIGYVKLIFTDIVNLFKF